MLEVRQLVKRVTEASDDELPNILGGISEWCWPRGDLHYYINILTPLRKRIILAILKYTRLLIENCTSRKLYASYEVSAEIFLRPS
jgi:E3 ubiquitin-protein ligase HUWE1